MAREDLSKRGKVGETYRSGSFAKAKKKGLKTADLSKKQLQRAQTARGRKVTKKQVTRATKNEASISDTQFETGKGVTKGGKLFTGTVTLASGRKATYVKGRRVVASKKAPAKPARSRGGSGGRTTSKPRATTTRVSPSARGEGAGRVTPTRQPVSKVARQATDSFVSMPRNASDRSRARNLPGRTRRRPASWLSRTSRGQWNPTTRRYER